MNKNLFSAMLLSVVTVMMINYMTQRSPSVPQATGGEVALSAEPLAGQPLLVPSREELFSPLNFSMLEVDQEPVSDDRYAVKTDKRTVYFSSRGAVVTGIDYHQHKSKSGFLSSVQSDPQLSYDRFTEGLFLLGIDQHAPRSYTRLAEEDFDDHKEVTFVTNYLGWKIQKKYMLDKKNYALDLAISCEKVDSAAGAIQPRLFVTAPEVPALSGDQLSFLTLQESQKSIEKKELSTLANRAWYWTTGRPIVGFENKYFVHALYADQSFFIRRAYAQVYSDKAAVVLLEGPRVDQSKAWTVSFYLGPKTLDALSNVDERLEELLAFGWFSWFCRWLLVLLSYLYGLVGNYGFAIILLSIILKLPFVPLSVYAKNKSDEYQRYQPTMNRIRAKYKDDLARQQAEIMKFCADHNLSLATPALGCLPLLLQVPIMISLYRILSGHIALYQAPFIGWITDLSAHDPFYVLPILMGALMAWQQSMVPMQDEKQRFLMMLMPLVMTGVFSGFPAGLVLYWLMNNNILALVEDFIRKLIYPVRSR